MTACCETKRADLTSEEGERGDGSPGVTETELVDGVTCGEDGNLGRLISEQSSQDVSDGSRAVEVRPLTIADAGRYDEGEPSLRGERFVGENNADRNALISRDLDESAGVSGSKSSARPISRETTVPVGNNHPVNVPLLDFSHVYTTTSVTAAASDCQCNFSTPSQKTNSDTFVRNNSRLSCHQHYPRGGLDVTNPGLTACDDGTQASGACVGNETTSNNLVTSHRSGSGLARDNSISSPGFAGSERETVDSNISLTVPRAVDHRPFQSAAGATGTTGAATLNNRVKGDKCIQRGSSIQAGHYSPAPCLDFDSENRDKPDCSFHLGVSEPTDTESSITESLIDSGGLKYSIPDYSVSSEKSCKELCHHASTCFNVDGAHKLLIDNTSLSPHIHTEEIPCSQSQISAATVATQISAPTAATQISAATVATQISAATVATQISAATVATQISAATVATQISAPTVATQISAPTVATQISAATVATQISAPTVARYALHDVGNRPRSQSLEDQISGPCDTSDHCQARTADSLDVHDLDQGKNKTSWIRPCKLVTASWNVPHAGGLAPTVSLPQTEERKQQPGVRELNAPELGSCHILIEPTAGTTRDSDPHPDPGPSYPTSWLSSSCSDLVTSLGASFPSTELTNPRAPIHPLIGSVPRAQADPSDVSIIDSAQTRLSVSDSDQSTEAINHLTLEDVSSVDCRRFSAEHCPKPQQLWSGGCVNELSHPCAQSPCHQKPVSQIRVQESQHFTGRQSLHKVSRTLSTSSEEWPDAAPASNNYYRDKERHDSSFVSLEDATNIGLQQRRRSFGRQRQRANHSLGASCHLFREDSGLQNESASDNDECDATSALLTADSDEEFQDQRQLEAYNSGGRGHDECDGVALFSKQQHPERAKNSHEKPVSGRTNFSRLVQFYCKDILRIRNHSDNNSSHTSAYTSATCRQLNGDSFRQLSRVSNVNINTSTKPASAPTAASSALVGSTTPAATTTGPADASGKPRDSFISGLRRLSRERAAFLRVDHSDFTECTSGSSSHLQDGSADTEVHKTGKKIGSGDRKKLKVEFAVMEGEGEKYIRGRGRGFGGGNYGGGLHNVKDDVENDVAMLGGGGLRFRQPRVSLLGKPLNYRAHRRDIKYRKLQSRIYNFLERPKSWQSWIYHLTV